jgi:type I restriction enzyme, S subunit
LTTDSIKSSPVVYPPLAEQQAIASILGSLDDKIELLRQQNKTLEAIGQAIFKSWFVDFDGVTEFEDSELGPIPKGWKVGKLGEM